jgi:hypothetical protein
MNEANVLNQSYSYYLTESIVPGFDKPTKTANAQLHTVEWMRRVAKPNPS